MTDTFREGRLGREPRHRVDEIHVHRRRPMGLLWALLALLLVGLLALWAFRRERPSISAPAVNAPELDVPELERRAGPVKPEPARPDPGRPDPNLAVPPPPAGEEQPMGEQPSGGEQAAAEDEAEREPTAGQDQPAEPAAPEAAPEGEAAQAACETETVFHFTTNASALRGRDEAALQKLADCFKADPELTARLEGRADATGTPEHNESLALSRAQTVKQRLVELGAPESQLSVVVSDPKCEEMTAACNQQNRSVTVVIDR